MHWRGGGPQTRRRADMRGARESQVSGSDEAGLGAAVDVERFARGPLKHVQASLARTMRGVREQDRDDAVSEAVLRALEQLDRFESDQHLRNWVRRVARNVLLTGINNADTRNTVLCADVTDVADPAEPDALALLLRDEQYADLLAALRALPPRQLRAVVEMVVNGKSRHEFAAEQGMSGPAAGQLLHRGVAALRKMCGTGRGMAVVPVVLLTRPRRGFAMFLRAHTTAATACAGAASLSLTVAVGGLAVPRPLTEPLRFVQAWRPTTGPWPISLLPDPTGATGLPAHPASRDEPQSGADEPHQDDEPSIKVCAAGRCAKVKKKKLPTTNPTGGHEACVTNPTGGDPICQREEVTPVCHRVPDDNPAMKCNDHGKPEDGWLADDPVPA